jgi:polysaccharide export outer membrane protein
MLRFLLILALLTGACHDDPPVTYPTVAPLDLSKLHLGAGDKFTLTVYYGSHSFNAAYTLDNTGLISVQFIGNVQAGGKTLNEVQQDIQKRLADGYINDPIVSLSIAEVNSLWISVSGMVQRTGNMKFTPGMTVVDVIAQSGGFTPMARKNMVKVTRSVNGTKETYKLPVEMMAAGERPSFPMMPGDEVFVPERPW